jgi:hypothetical protein
MVARDRRALRINLSTNLSPGIIHLIGDLACGPWRNTLSIDSFVPTRLTVYEGNGEGYDASGYVDRLGLKIQRGNLVGLEISITCWVWNHLLGGTTPIISQGLNPVSYNYKPIPHWKALFNSTLVSAQAIVTDWDINLNNNWTFENLLEATLEPPNPSQIYPGPLDGDISIKWLAKRNDKPAESGSGTISFLDPREGNYTPLYRLSIPFLIRESRSIDGFGEGDSPLQWDASYRVTQINPILL